MLSNFNKVLTSERVVEEKSRNKFLYRDYKDGTEIKYKALFFGF